MRSQKGIKFEYLLGLFVLALIAFFAYQYYVAVPPKPTAQVQCGPVLVQQYGLAGTQVTEALQVQDPNGNPISGANVYSFNTQPYYWSSPELFAYLDSIIEGATPVATTGTNGQANISVSIPQPGTSPVSYVILQASGYWTEPYVFTVSINPLLTADSEEQCLQIYNYATVQQILPSLVQVSARRVIDGQIFGLKNLQMIPLATYTTVNPISFGVSQNQTGANLQGVSTFYVTNGELRITGILLNVTANSSLQSEGIHQITLKVTIGGTTVYNGIVYDQLNANAPLGSGAQGATYTISIPNGVIRVGAGQSVVVQVSAIADTSTVPTSGRLSPGEPVLNISLELASPLTGQPIVIPITG